MRHGDVRWHFALCVLLLCSCPHDSTRPNESATSHPVTAQPQPSPADASEQSASDGVHSDTSSTTDAAPPGDAHGPLGDAHDPSSDAVRYGRPMPDTWDRIYVFPDQLSLGHHGPLIRFVAENYVGTQKMTERDTSRIRRLSPGFIVFQYRLAFGLSTADNIVARNRWDRDTIEPDGPEDPRRTREDFYLHHPPETDRRVLHGDHYYLADVRNQAWQDYQINELLRRMPLNDFDGVFLDTAHIRIDRFNPYEWFTSFCDPDVVRLCGCWTPPATAYFERLVRRFREGERAFYAIGNFGALITGWDRAEYMAPLDGGMVEMFMGSESPLNEGDWHIAAERIARLIGNDKIFIAQPVNYPMEDMQTRHWMIANFLLFKGHRSFVAFYPRGFRSVQGPTWFPEYDIDIGAPQAAVPNDYGTLCTGRTDGRSCGGVYLRAFERGVVVVNPSAESRQIALPAPPAGQRYGVAVFSGGGRVRNDGSRATQSLSYRPIDGASVTVNGSSGMVLALLTNQGELVAQ